MRVTGRRMKQTMIVTQLHRRMVANEKVEMMLGHCSSAKVERWEVAMVRLLRLMAREMDLYGHFGRHWLDSLQYSFHATVLVSLLSHSLASLLLVLVPYWCCCGVVVSVSLRPPVEGRRRVF